MRVRETEGGKDTDRLMELANLGWIKSNLHTHIHTHTHPTSISVGTFTDKLAPKPNLPPDSYLNTNKNLTLKQTFEVVGTK